MNLWGWVIVYAATFVLVQVLVYLYYLRKGREGSTALGDGGVPGGEPSTRPATADWRVTDPSAENRAVPDGPEDGRPCPHCGAVNAEAAQYRYCRNCTRQIRT